MKLEEEEKDAEFEAPIKVSKVAVATGHTNSVAAVQFSKHKDKPFILSVSDDGTLKLWPIQKILTHFGGERLVLGEIASQLNCLVSNFLPHLRSLLIIS